MSEIRAARRADESAATSFEVDELKAIERKLLWLSSWTIHHANHLRPNEDGLKVGGHQASSASLATVMTALYFRILRPEDRVAVKPHASPVFHAIQYLLGNQTAEKLKSFRGYGGAQSYPSRTKDVDDVDFSTGSVGLGVAVTAFASLVQDYLKARDWMKGRPAGRMVALLGDAELDEGNIFECLLEGWKHDLRNCWWIIDYNRQSLDSVVSDALFQKHADVFRALGWHVVTIKFGRRLQEAGRQPGGEALLRWVDECPNALYSALVFQGGASWRNQLKADLAGERETLELIEAHDDEALAELMSDLGGHCMESVVEAFESAPSDGPVCFIAYTVKGHGLPFKGHKDNHAGLMTKEQMETLRRAHGVEQGAEWEPFAGLPDDLPARIGKIPFAAKGRRRHEAPQVSVPRLQMPPIRGAMSTQEGFGKILDLVARSDSELADRIVTTSPDVTVSTNLGPWVNRRAIFSRTERGDVFQERKLMSAQRWDMGPSGQHIELGIAENNLFLTLAAAGMSHSLFGERLLPIGTLYDPFIARGLDALNYACYQDARFILVGTPSGVTLAPEGGAHQSIGTPLIGMAQDGLAAFEPAYVDELGVILEWAFGYIQRSGSAAKTDWLHEREGGSVYLRLSTRSVDQPIRDFDEDTREAIIAGGYWMRKPARGARLAIAYAGAVAPEAASALGQLLEREPGAGLLAVTSADRLNAGWTAAQKARRRGAPATAHVETLLEPLAPDARIVTVLDGHPATLAWLGGVRGHRVQALGVEHFGQTGTIQDLYRHFDIDDEAIGTAARAR
ncbi:pyruvate dehydrogenase E1 component [Lutibaculum baratangense]|uniref:Pyruvate dehydrogenase E1 component n=1 Tax=Lutibaculum baratangense AMV1 TaxID=631454 RepID=V4RKL0_9HYPH|nr:pyruvate dehydrogenase E1 component [Lutibaculum baratangense]ESR26591.1 Pyruvate dehydrogenase E1 component [Lutibaculum baratangense AMV1]